MKSRYFVLHVCRRIVNAALTAMLLAFFMLPAEATSLVANGNFETLKEPGVSSQFGVYYAYQEVTSWSTSGYNFVFTPGTADTTGAPGQYGQIYLWGPGNGANNGLSTSPAGGNFLAFDGGTHVGAVTQTIKGLTAGDDYGVSFYYAAAQQHGYAGSTTEQFKVSLGTESETTPVLSAASHGFSGWHYETLTFKAASASEVLSFLASGTPTGVPPYALLDGVSLYVVPEPATWALLVLAGCLGLVFMRVRRKSARTAKQAD